MQVDIGGKRLLDEHINLGYAQYEQEWIEDCLWPFGMSNNTHCNSGLLCILCSSL